MRRFGPDLHRGGVSSKTLLVRGRDRRVGLIGRVLRKMPHSFPSALGSSVSMLSQCRETLISSFGDLDCRFCLRDNWTSETGIRRHASAYCTKFYALFFTAFRRGR